MKFIKIFCNQMRPIPPMTIYSSVIYVDSQINLRNFVYLGYIFIFQDTTLFVRIQLYFVSTTSATTIRDHSTVTDLAKFRGLSTSVPSAHAVW